MKYRRLKKNIFGILAALTMLLMSVSPLVKPVSAQTSTTSSLSIAISPPTFYNLTGDPGEMVTGKLKITNLSDNAINVAMLVKDYAPVGESGEVGLVSPASDPNYSLSNWIQVTPPFLTLAAKKDSYVEFTIHVPINAEPGGRYASIIAAVGGVANNNTSGSSVGTEIGSLLALTVPGAMKISANVASFSTNPGFSQGGKTILHERIKNDGNIHGQSSGSVTIKNMFGKEVKTVSIPTVNIFPGSIRDIPETINTDNWVGRYTATMVLGYKSYDTNQVLTSTTTFWVVPVYKIIAVLFVLIFVIVFRKNLYGAISQGVKGFKGRN